MAYMLLSCSSLSSCDFEGHVIQLVVEQGGKASRRTRRVSGS